MKFFHSLQDLSNISLPVTTNEPISALQRIAEELEYSELLDRAVAADDPMERLTLVAVFAISTYGGNKYRVTRKPFNPLLGETFEWIRPDKGRFNKSGNILCYAETDVSIFPDLQDSNSSPKRSRINPSSSHSMPILRSMRKTKAGR